eukprot:6184951-Pleurochrysis_carterae.AAC.2
MRSSSSLLTGARRSACKHFVDRNPITDEKSEQHFGVNFGSPRASTLIAALRNHVKANLSKTVEDQDPQPSVQVRRQQFRAAGFSSAKTAREEKAATGCLALAPSQQHCHV